MRSEGFTLLESLLAVTLVATIGVTLLSSLARNVQFERQLLDRYNNVEWARSLLEEYIALYPEGATKGSSLRGLAWTVVEQPATPDSATRYDSVIEIIEITVTLDPAKGRAGTSLTQSVVRKRR